MERREAEEGFATALLRSATAFLGLAGRTEPAVGVGFDFRAGDDHFSLGRLDFRRTAHNK